MFYKVVKKFAFWGFSISVAFEFILDSSNFSLSYNARIALLEEIRNILKIIFKIVSTYFIEPHF